MQALVLLKSSSKHAYATRNASIKYQRSKVQLIGATLKEKGSTRQKSKQMKRITPNEDKLLHNIIEMTVNISIASTMGLVITSQMSVTSPSTSGKDAHAMNARKDPARSR
eukprot:8112528-Ditylum_brightwellii.AAC.1